MATDKQIAANRLNATLSTGPKTDEGKRRSRANAYKHGMTGEGVVVSEAVEAAITERKSLWSKDYPRESDQDDWTFDKLIVASIQIDRCDMNHDSHLVEHAARATAAWEIDREVEASKLAATLHGKPDLVSKQLQTTKHGCLWLLTRWAMLGEKLDDPTLDGWDEDERSMALDMMGVDLALRRGRTMVDPDEGEDAREYRRELVVTQVTRLAKLLQLSLERLDAEAQRDARQTVGAELTPKGQKISRYKREAWSLFFRCKAALTGEPAAPPQAKTPAAPRPPAVAAPQVDARPASPRPPQMTAEQNAMVDAALARAAALNAERTARDASAAGSVAAVHRNEPNS